MKMHEIKQRATQFWIIVSPVLLLKLLKTKRKTKTLSTLCFSSFFFFVGTLKKVSKDQDQRDEGNGKIHITFTDSFNTQNNPMK